VDPLNKKQWFMINDTVVAEVNEDQVLETISGGRTLKDGAIINNQPVAYILCYIKTSQISENVR